MIQPSNRAIVVIAARLKMLNDAGRNCTGDCAEEARRAFEAATLSAKPPAPGMADLDKRFRLLRDVSSTDKHQEAEITLEHALALYEATFGQDHPSVAYVMLALSDLYQEHGNPQGAQYMRTWADEIFHSPQNEPQHEFFHLFGMNTAEQSEDGGQS